MLKKLMLNFLFLLKKLPAFKSIAFVTGQVELEHYVAKTGKVIKTVLPMGLINFNTVNNNLKYALAALISTTGNSRWIGTNGLIASNVSATADGEDGIAETTSDYPYVTTKDSGGTGSQNWVKFKGVRTAAGSETHANLELGLDFNTGSSFTTIYATQTISKSLSTSDVLTVYWTITIS